MEEKKTQRYSDLIEIGIVIAFLFLIASLYVPVGIWEEEGKINDLAHFRMQNIQNVENFYANLVEGYTEDAKMAIILVNATRDSVIADSNFIGEQNIKLDGKLFSVNIPKGFDAEFDTTFGILKSRRDTIMDTILTIVNFDKEIQRNDTIYIQIKDLDEYQNEPGFVGVVESVPTKRVELVNYYDTFYPDSTFLICPVTDKKYKVKVDDKGIRIESPMEKPYKERLFAIFTLEIKEHGYIENGVPSWSD